MSPVDEILWPTSRSPVKSSVPLSVQVEQRDGASMSRPAEEAAHEGPTMMPWDRLVKVDAYSAPHRRAFASADVRARAMLSGTRFVTAAAYCLR